MNDLSCKFCDDTYSSDFEWAVPLEHAGLGTDIAAVFVLILLPILIVYKIFTV